MYALFSPKTAPLVTAGPFARKTKLFLLPWHVRWECGEHTSFASYTFPKTVSSIEIGIYARFEANFFLFKTCFGRQYFLLILDYDLDENVSF